MGRVGSSLQRRAVQRLIAAQADLPLEARTLPRIDHAGNLGAQLWCDANPELVETFVSGCCYGEALGGPLWCTCWEPVFTSAQAQPVLPASADEVETRARMCGDCAFRPDSPERADEWTEEELLALPETGETFWCHDGMRRPDHWRHPDGRTVPGSTADWRPPIVAGMPFRADGRPGLLCAGWNARVVAAQRREQ